MLLDALPDIPLFARGVSVFFMSTVNGFCHPLREPNCKGFSSAGCAARCETQALERRLPDISSIDTHDSLQWFFKRRPST